MNYLNAGNQILDQPLLQPDPRTARVEVEREDPEEPEPQSLKNLLLSLLQEYPDIKDFYDKDFETTNFQAAFKEVRGPLLDSINAAIQGEENPLHIAKLINERIPKLKTLHDKVRNLFFKYPSLQKCTNQFLTSGDKNNPGLVFFIFLIQSLIGSTITPDQKFYMELPAQDVSYAHLEKGQKHRFGAFTFFKASKPYNAKNYFEIEIPKKVSGYTYNYDNEFCMLSFPDTEFIIQNVEKNGGKIIRLRFAIQESLEEEFKEDSLKNPNEDHMKNLKEETKNEPRMARRNVRHENSTYEKIDEFDFERFAENHILINFGGQEFGEQKPTGRDLEANPRFMAESDEESRALRITREAQIQEFLIVFRLIFYGFLLLLFKELLDSHMGLDRK